MLEQTRDDEQSVPRFILSIDGGGIRGLIPACILQVVEEQTEQYIQGTLLRQMTQKRGKSFPGEMQFPFTFHLAYAFDLMVGTSTGGIITLGLTTPHLQMPQQPRYKIDTLVNLYRKKGAEIFPVIGSASKLSSLFSFKYTPQSLENLFQKYFGDTRLGEAVTDVLITAYEMREERLHLLDSWKAKKSQGPNFFFRDAARATSAAPTYFSSVTVTYNNERHLFADGEIIANNPALAAYMTAKSRYPGEKIILLSLGTGKAAHDSVSAFKDKGLLGWGPDIAGIMMSGASDLNHDLLHAYAQASSDFQYLRLNPHLTKKWSEMDNPDPENLHYLEALGRKEALSSHELKAFIKILGDAYIQKGRLSPSLWEEVKAQQKLGSRLQLDKRDLNFFQAFVLSSFLKNLSPFVRELSLRDNPLGDEGLLYLSDSLSSLQVLDVSHAKLSVQSLKLITKNTPYLVSLGFGGNALAKEDLSFLGHLRSLISLDFSACTLKDFQIDSLVQAFPSLVSLTLSKNTELGPETGIKIIQGFSVLETLNADRTHIAGGVIPALINSSSLTDLNLSHNRMTSEHAKALANILKTQSRLTSLTLRYNDITPEGIESLAWSLTTPGLNLKTLDLSNNHIGESALVLGKVLPDISSLTSLDVRKGFIEDAGALDLAQAWQARDSFKILSLESNSLSERARSELKKIKDARRFKELTF